MKNLRAGTTSQEDEKTHLRQEFEQMHGRWEVSAL
jgi:hypothetical protein